MPKLAAWVPQNGLSCEGKKPNPSLRVSRDDTSFVDWELDWERIHRL